jgi:putative ATP-binding cassette transporter
VTAGYGWFTIVAPIIVAAPAFFAGNLSFGGLLMSAGAFTQVQQSLRWVVDNAGAIADWRATLHRVGAFRIALLELDKTGETRSRITVETTANARLVLENLKVFLPSGSIGLSEPRVEVEPGQRILIVAAAGSGKTCLFRAIAGLWPWGAGRIGLPAGDRVMFMPQRPFIPDGAIDRILAYPDPPETFTEAQLVSTLTRMRLGHLAPRLRRLASSDQELSYDEQLALVFARLLLRKPDCVVVDEALEALTPETRELVFDILAKELAATSLLAIDGPRAETAPYDRVFHLVFDPEDPGLARSDESRKGA